MVRIRASRHDREILRLAVPAFGALVAEPLFLLSDSAIVGHLGTAQLGGLGVAGQALNTLVYLCVFLAYGTTAGVARQIGAANDEHWHARSIGGGVPDLLGQEIARLRRARRQGEGLDRACREVAAPDTGGIEERGVVEIGDLGLLVATEGANCARSR